MGDQCELDPGRECHNGTRIALLESRVESLEEGQGREEKFRKTYYEDREKRIERDAKLDERLKTIDENLEKLVKRQAEEDQKPRQRWEGFVDKVVWAIAAAVIAFLLGRLGL